MRKRITLLVLGVLIWSIFFISACNAPEDETVLYINETYGFSVLLSDEFSENVDIINDGQTVYFMDKEIKNQSVELFSGIVGQIEVYEKKITSRAALQEKVESNNLQYLGENETNYFGWTHAKEIQVSENAPEEAKNRFYKMEQEFGHLINSFKVLEESKEIEALALVEEFGQQLHKVSLQASPDSIKKTMEENYGTFASPSLIEKWSKEPQNAPGRQTSSPWPDRIEVQYAEPIGEEIYKVEGIIIEITSDEKEHGGVAARRPITLIVKKAASGWQIDDVTLGRYQ
ncbi:MAG: hypothetical protein ACOX2Q_06395 [Dehalobacterium sp.]|jgi:hypothetical protein